MARGEDVVRTKVVLRVRRVRVERGHRERRRRKDRARLRLVDPGALESIPDVDLGRRLPHRKEPLTGGAGVGEDVERELVVGTASDRQQPLEPTRAHIGAGAFDRGRGQCDCESPRRSLALLPAARRCVREVAGFAGQASVRRVDGDRHRLIAAGAADRQRGRSARPIPTTASRAVTITKILLRTRCSYLAPRDRPRIGEEAAPRLLASRGAGQVALLLDRGRPADMLDEDLLQRRIGDLEAGPQNCAMVMFLHYHQPRENLVLLALGSFSIRARAFFLKCCAALGIGFLAFSAFLRTEYAFTSRVSMWVSSEFETLF